MTLADFIPPPKAVVLYDTGNLTAWPDEEIRYTSTKSGTFDLYVEHGRFNVLIVRENGKVLDGVGRNAVEARREKDGKNESYYIRDVAEQDASKMTAKSKITIVTGGQPREGSFSTAEILEKSVSPKFRGTSQEMGPPLTVRVCSVERPARISKFDATRVNRGGSSTTLAWKVQHTKHVELWQDGKKIHDTLSPLPSQDFSGWQSVSTTGSYQPVFKLRAENAVGQGEERIATMTVGQASPARDVATVVEGAPVTAGETGVGQPFSVCFFCQNTGNGGSFLMPARSEREAIVLAQSKLDRGCEASMGTHQRFTFCTMCPSENLARSEYTVAACSLDQAKDWTLAQKGSCDIREGTCWSR